MVPERIATPRLVLRRLEDRDIPQLVTLLGDWQVTRWLARVPHPYGEQDARSYLRDVTAPGARDLHYAIALGDQGAETDLLIGGIGLMMPDEEGQRSGSELGYWVGNPYWGKGYITEALPPFLELAYGPLSEPLIYARVMADNLRSRAVLERLGFDYKGLRPTFFPMRQHRMLVPHYEMSQAEWGARLSTMHKTDLG